MENCIMEELLQNKKIRYIKYIGIYFFIAIFTVIINVIIYDNVTGDIFAHITNYMSKYFKFLQIQPFIIWSNEFGRYFIISLMVNLLLLLLIEFIIVIIFQKKLNILFKKDNLFTIKNYLIIACASIIIQIIFSCLFWTGNIPGF